MLIQYKQVTPCRTIQRTHDKAQVELPDDLHFGEVLFVESLFDLLVGDSTHETVEVTSEFVEDLRIYLEL